MWQNYILHTHYGCVRYLYYEVFRKSSHQVDNLNCQTLYLNAITKYLLCRDGQYAHLYNMYTNLSKTQIIDYFISNRAKMNLYDTTWLDHTYILPSPNVLPNTIDGPYTIENLCLRRYSYFWKTHLNVTSNILATPFYCLDGIDHIYYELIRWKSECENLDVDIHISTEHIYHEIFYIVSLKGSTEQTREIHFSFLLWLDSPNIQSELYCSGMSGDVNCDYESNSNIPLNLLKQLYITCNDIQIFYRSQTQNKSLRLINMLMKTLSNNFVVTFNGKEPINTKVTVLNLTNSISDSSNINNNLRFENIVRRGFSINSAVVNDYIYEIESFSEINLSYVKTPYILFIQHNIGVITKPSISEMSQNLQIMLYLLSFGIIDKNIFLRVGINSKIIPNYTPNGSKRRLQIIYMQKYNRSQINTTENVDFNSTFFDYTYVFLAPNLFCNVKSISHLIKNCLTSPPLLPSIVQCLNSNDIAPILWKRITQNIVYLNELNTICILSNFTIQNVDSVKLENMYDYNYVSNSKEIIEKKSMFIQPEMMIREYLDQLFSPISINSCDIVPVLNFADVLLKCIKFNPSLNLEIYFFTTSEQSTIEDFKSYFMRFMSLYCNKKDLPENLNIIFLHLYNIYLNNII